MDNAKKRLSQLTLAHLLILVAMVLIVLNIFSPPTGKVTFGIGTLKSLILVAVPVLVFLKDQKSMKEIIGWLLIAAGGLWIFTSIMAISRGAMGGGIVGITRSVPEYAPSLCVLGAGLRLALDENCPKGLDRALEFIGMALTLFCGLVFFATFRADGIRIPMNCLIAVGYSLLPGMEFSESKKGIVNRKMLIWLAVIATVVFILGRTDFVSGGGGGGGNSRTCKSCGRTFTDSANTNSITRTGMCKNCYNNFQWGMAATGRDTAWHIHGEDEDCESMTLTFRSAEETEFQELLCKLDTAADWSDAA